MPDPDRRNPRLDGLRGLAIALVVCFHSSQSFEPASRIGEGLALLLRLGWSGVDLFFVLSGFLITGILLRSRDDPHYFRTFYARRFLRIVPIYYAVLAFALFVLPRIPALEPVNYLFLVPPEQFEGVWYWLFLSNFAIAASGFQHATLGVSWSLAIEEQFYLVWPLVVRGLTSRGLLGLCAVIVVGSPVARALALAAGTDPVATWVLAPFHLDGLALGALVALWLHGSGPVDAQRWLAWTRWLLAACAAGVVVGAVGADWVHSPWGRSLFLDAGMQTWGLTLLLLAYTALLCGALLAPEGSAWARVLGWSPIVVLGRYSYAIYLLHGLVNQVLNQFLPYWSFGTPMARGAGLVAYCGLSLGLTLLAARGTWVVIEAPFQRLKRHFPYGG